MIKGRAARRARLQVRPAVESVDVLERESLTPRRTPSRSFHHVARSWSCGCFGMLLASHWVDQAKDLRSGSRKPEFEHAAPALGERWPCGWLTWCELRQRLTQLRLSERSSRTCPALVGRVTALTPPNGECHSDDRRAVILLRPRGAWQPAEVCSWPHGGEGVEPESTWRIGSETAIDVPSIGLPHMVIYMNRARRI